MEEGKMLPAVGGVCFKPHQAKSLCNNIGQSEKLLSTGAQAQDKILINSFNKHSSVDDLTTTTSPNHAMEFLCRSWSPSASDFLHLFPRNLIVATNDADDKITDHEEIVDPQMNAVQENRAIVPFREHNINRDIIHKKGWLGGLTLSSFLMSRKKKKREQLRLHTANLHATLSLTQLAAAITGFATTYSVNADNNKHLNHEGIVACNGDMSSVVASAAALMTTVCAEAAEYIGASRSQVASAIHSGLATQTPIDMIALTATSATCLRGAAILRSREMTNYFSRTQDMPKIGSQLYVITPSGQRGYTWVTLNSNQRRLILGLKTKYLRGVLTATREHEIIRIEGTEGESYSLKLKTSKGSVKLIFEDEKQFSVWISIICSLLEHTKALLTKQVHLLWSYDHNSSSASYRD